MTTRYLTLKQLQRAAACSSYMNTFKALFPTGKVKVNSLTVDALAQWANFYFLEAHILSTAQKKVYARTLAGSARVGSEIATLRELVPDFRNLSIEKRSDLIDAFRSHVYKEQNIRMAAAFNAAYNSPRK